MDIDKKEESPSKKKPEAKEEEVKAPNDKFYGEYTLFG